MPLGERQNKSRPALEYERAPAIGHSLVCAGQCLMTAAPSSVGVAGGTACSSLSLSSDIGTG